MKGNWSISFYPSKIYVKITKKKNIYDIIRKKQGGEQC